MAGVLKLVLVTIAALAVVLLVQYPLRRKHSGKVNVICFIIKVILTGTLSLLIAAINSWVIWHIPVILNAVYIAILADAMGDIIRGIVWFIKRNRSKARQNTHVSVVIISAVA